MIPLKDQEMIQQKLAAEMGGPIKIDLFTERESRLEVQGKTPCAYCKPAQEMLQELSGLSDLISLRVHIFDEAPEDREKFGVERIPAIVLRGQGASFLLFYGIPAGTEFPMLLETLIDLSRGEVLFSEASAKALLELEAAVTVKVFVTPTCAYCPGMMRAAFQAAMVSDKVRAEVIEVNEFPELGDRYAVKAVPLTVFSERVAVPGAMPEKTFVEHIVKVADQIAAETPAETPQGPQVKRGEQRPSGLIIP